MNMLAAAMRAAEEFDAVAAGIDWSAFDLVRRTVLAAAEERAAIEAAMDGYRTQQATIAAAVDQFRKHQAAIDEYARRSEAIMAAAKQAMAPAPQPIEYYVPERFHPTLMPSPRFHSALDMEPEPSNERTIVRPEVKRKIGFRR